MKNLSTLLFSAILMTSLSHAEDQHKHQEQTDKHHNANTSGIEALSDDLRDLLTQEMIALQDGMMSIIPAYISGDWDDIATTAGNIKDSYILQQKLTADQISELHSLLPEDFIKQDQHFHYLAGMLEHAAKHKKPELINFYFSEMNESCVACHSDYATHKFPALAPEKKEGHTH